MRSIFYFLPLLVSVACALPVEDGGRLSRYRYKTTSFTDVDGNTLEDSYSNEGAELNDEPLYIVTNEGQLKLMNGQEPDVREAYDVYNPVENIHQHAGRINDQAETYIEPLEQNAVENEVALIPEMMNDEVEEMESLPVDFGVAELQTPAEEIVMPEEDIYYAEDDGLSDDYYEA